MSSSAASSFEHPVAVDLGVDEQLATMRSQLDAIRPARTDREGKHPSGPRTLQRGFDNLGSRRSDAMIVVGDTELRDLRRRTIA